MSPSALQIRATCVALLGIVAVTFVAFRVVHANSTTTALLLLLVLLLSGLRLRFPGTILVSLIAAFCLDWYFIPPVGRITIEDPQGWVALIVFVTVALIASRLSTRLRQQRDELAVRQQEVEKLYAFSRSMLLYNGIEDVRRPIVNKCIELFGFTEVALFDQAGRIHRSETPGRISEGALRHMALYGSANQAEDRAVSILPIALGNKTYGSIGLRGAVPLSVAGRQSLVDTVAVGLARAQAQEAGNRAEAVRKSEELKSVMIDALAHDLKTPLTAIEAASQMLSEPDSVPEEQRRELLQVIREESITLRQRLAEAFHLARIDAKKLRLDLRPLSVDEMIQAAIRSLGERVGHRITTSSVESLAPVSGDEELMVQALKQLIDNAVKYSPPDALIAISAVEDEERLAISVRDNGQGLTELEQGRVFEKFYRGRYDRSAVQGTGMGLAIAKEIIEAHGGSIGVESILGQGSMFTLYLPKGYAITPLEKVPV